MKTSLLTSCYGLRCLSLATVLVLSGGICQAQMDSLFGSFSPFESGHCSLRHLRVMEDSTDATSFLVRVEYDYDGFSSIRLTPSISKQGSKQKLDCFDSSEPSVVPGRGTALFKIRYRTEESGIPPQLTTDKISIWATNFATRRLVGVTSFPQAITWGGRGETEDGPEEIVQPVKTVAALQNPAVPQPNPEPADKPDEKPAPPGSLSLAASGDHAAWRERLTLGPGDVLNFSLFGEPDLTRTEVFIGPDGRVSYLEAAGIMATGLTIDELRAKFDEELGKYRRAPRTMIAPTVFRSKKYFMLGKVAQKGVFTLDHPVTIVEAVARARGLEVELADRDVVEIADLSRSFLVRHGARVSVDFEKLFNQGDLSQNLALEPDDYLYFPPNDLKEVYVLGEVNHPGPVASNPNTTVINSISQCGGFTDRAWNRKVLVIRGSLSKPETFIVDAGAVLSAGIQDFKLQPKDIIYVSSRPWIKAEELLDAAATAFTEAVVVTWTGGSINLIR